MKNINNLIGVSGKKGSGKDTFYILFNELLFKHKINKKYENKKFADALKQVCSIIANIPIEYFYNRKYYDDVISPWNLTIREFMQKLGTDVIRNNFNQHTWLYSLFLQYNDNSNWIITDVRFKNEFDIIKQNNGIVIRIENENLKQNDEHISENDLDDYNFDYIIKNDKTIKEFKNIIENIFF